MLVSLGLMLCSFLVRYFNPFHLGNGEKSFILIQFTISNEVVKEGNLHAIMRCFICQ